MISPLNRGKFTGFLGRNGAGKTTLFNCLNGDIKYDVGRFCFEINEDRILNPKTIDEYFDFMSIEPRDRNKLLKDYSHGMKNKMQMLINIIAQPKLLLLDEPLTSLDVVVAEEMK